MASEPSNLGTLSFIRCGVVCIPDPENGVVSGCIGCGVRRFALRCDIRSERSSIFASNEAANFANNSSIFSDDRTFDLVPSAMLKQGVRRINESTNDTKLSRPR